MEKISEQRSEVVVRKEISKLLDRLDEYLPAYDAVDRKTQERWDKIAEKAADAETFSVLEQAGTAKELKKFLEELGGKINKTAN